MIQNLLCILEWSVLWHLYQHTMFQINLTNLLPWFAINMEMVQMEFWTTSRIIILEGSASMLQEVYQHFLSVFGICFTTQMTSFQEEIMQLRGGTESSKHTFLSVILCFGNFLRCYKGGNCCQGGNFTKWRWPPISSTKKKVHWLQPAYPQNCQLPPKSSKNWLFKKYSS